jgi:hypothetical protein
MNSTFARITCRILVATMIALPWQAQAGMIGTDVAVSKTVVDRAELVSRLQALGISPQAAQERVAALTDAEIAGLAGRVDALPAGGIAGVLPILVVAILVWWFVKGQHEQAQADSSKGKTSPTKPAPAPEKK